MKFKNILLTAILMASISLASATDSTSPFVLEKANTINSSLFSGPTSVFTPSRLCRQTCNTSYNNCLQNAVTPIQVDRCEIRLEVCLFGCSVVGDL